MTLQISRALLALLTMLSLLACAPRSGIHTPAMPSFNGIPDLATVATLTKAAASTADRPGAEFAQAGGTYTVNGSALELAPAAGELAFAIYSFTVPAGSEVQSVTVTGSSPQPTAWLGISDFAAGRWEFAEFDPSSGTVAVARPASELTASGCRFYVAVLAVAEALSIASVQVEHNGNSLSWNHSWGSEESDDLRYIGVDGAGSVYAGADRNNVSSGDEEPLLIKYLADGTLVAARQWVDPALLGNSLGMRALEVRPDGTAYWAWVGGANDNRDTFTLKTDPDLNLVWCRRFDTTGNDSFGGMGFDSLGNLVMQLIVEPDLGLPFGALVWIAPDGSLVRQLEIEFAYVDSNLIYRRFAAEPLTGDLLMIGSRRTALSSNPTSAVMRVDQSGNYVFSKLLTTTQTINASFSENGVTDDGAGNMLTVCHSIKPSGGPNDHIMLLRTDPAGSLLSANKLTIVGATQLLPQRIDVTTAGDPFVEIVLNFGSGNSYGLIAIDRASAAPLNWATFFTGNLDNDIAEYCGSYYLGNVISSGGTVDPVYTTGDQFTVTNILADVAWVDSGDTLVPLVGDFLTNQTASTLVAANGNADLLDTATNSEVMVRRFIP